MGKIGQAHVTAIGRPKGKGEKDAIPEALAAGTPHELARDLAALVGEAQVFTRALDLVRYASDASPYRYIPQVVVMARNAEDVRAVLTYCRENGRHATFRSGGTSLNGQAQSDDVLIDVRRHFYGMQVEDEGRLLRVRPGTVLAHANAVLARHRRRLGPDPASAQAATIGGVVANNAGGMRCKSSATPTTRCGR